MTEIVIDILGMPEMLKPLAVVSRKHGTDIRCGDMWTLAWDGEYRGLACIAEAEDGYCLVWPVTLEAEFSHAPGVRVDFPGLDAQATFWPTRETGIGNHLLHHNLGRLLDPVEVERITDSLDLSDGEGVTFAPDAVDLAAATAFDDHMVDVWADLSWHALVDGGARCKPGLSGPGS